MTLHLKHTYDPLLDKNVLATDQDVADRLEKDTDNAFLPKRADKKDTILTMFHKETKKMFLLQKKMFLLTWINTNQKRKQTHKNLQ